MDTISISVLCTIGGFIVALITLQRKSNKDIRADTREDEQTKAKLDYIATAVDEIRLDNKARDREMTQFNIRLVKVEESSKSAHKRLDKLEGKVNE